MTGEYVCLQRICFSVARAEVLLLGRTRITRPEKCSRSRLLTYVHLENTLDLVGPFHIQNLQMCFGAFGFRREQEVKRRGKALSLQTYEWVKKGKFGGERSKLKNNGNEPAPQPVEKIEDPPRPAVLLLRCRDPTGRRLAAARPLSGFAAMRQHHSLIHRAEPP